MGCLAYDAARMSQHHHSQKSTQLQKLQERKAALDQKKAALNARIRDLETKGRHQERKSDTRRKIIIGALAMEYMRLNRAFSDALWPLLDQYVTREQDRELLNAYLTAVALPRLPAGEKADTARKASMLACCKENRATREAHGPVVASAS